MNNINLVLLILVLTINCGCATNQSTDINRIRALGQVEGYTKAFMDIYLYSGKHDETNRLLGDDIILCKLHMPTILGYLNVDKVSNDKVINLLGYHYYFVRRNLYKNSTDFKLVYNGLPFVSKKHDVIDVRILKIRTKGDVFKFKQYVVKLFNDLKE